MLSHAPRHVAIAFAERLAEAAGVTLISQETADAIDRAYARMTAGLPVSERELADIRYAIAAASPTSTKDFWKVYA